MASDKDRDASETPTQASPLREMAKQVMSAFVIPPNEDQLFEPITRAIAAIPEPFRDAAKNLRANLTGLLSVASMPYTLSQRSSVNSNWQRIHMASRIRSLNLDALPGESEEALETRRNAEALDRAKPEMDKFVSSTQGREAVIRNTLEILEGLRSDESLAEAANELILQSTVLCWGAFEVLARDCFTTHLNLNPSRTLVLLADPVAKRRFELTKISIETLGDYGFDLSTRMGTLLADQQDLSDVYSVKAVYHALFPNDHGLRDAVSDPDLRMLSLRRNLIVHRGGMIDATYIDSTACSQRMGEHLRLAPEDLERHVGTTVRTAVSILLAVSAA